MPHNPSRSRFRWVFDGICAGLIGGVTIWIYEAVVWVGIQHQMPLEGIPRNAVGLVFGNALRDRLGVLADVMGTVIHFSFAAVWGVVFAGLWPVFARRGTEATFAGLVYGAVVWVAMHLAIMAAGQQHPDYSNANVVIGGLMSHFFYGVPLALWVKRQFARSTTL